MNFFAAVSFALRLHELTACPRLWYHDRHVHCLLPEAGECWCPSLIWIWSHTDWLSGSANLEKEKPTNNKKYFFHTCKLSIFSILFWGQFTTVSQEAEMHIRSWFVILLTCMYFYGLLAYLKLNKDLY